MNYGSASPGIEEWVQVRDSRANSERRFSMDEKLKKAVGELASALQSHHDELASLSQQIEKLEQQRAVLKAAAVVQLQAQAESLRISRESIGHLVAGCL
jgi:hypothetical protein